MTVLMQKIYEHISNSRMTRYIDYAEYQSVTRQLEHLEAEVSAALPGDGRQAFQRYLDAQQELSSIELEAMFQAAFAAARELT